MLGSIPAGVVKSKRRCVSQLVESTMKILMTAVWMAVGMLISTVGYAQAPAGSTGACKDGTYTTAASKRGACSGHGGVKDWYGTAAPAAAAPAAGGGPGQVWVNTASKVYHCQGDRYYGKTKQGEYMTESAAKAAGAHPDHGKACS